MRALCGMPSKYHTHFLTARTNITDVPCHPHGRPQSPGEGAEGRRKGSGVSDLSSNWARVQKPKNSSSPTRITVRVWWQGL